MNLMNVALLCNGWYISPWDSKVKCSTLVKLAFVIENKDNFNWRKKWQPTPVSFVGKIPRTEVPGRLQSMGITKSLTQLSD